MTRYAITIKGIGAGGWRIRTTSAAEFRALSRHLVDSAAAKFPVANLQALFPQKTAEELHAHGTTAFNATLKAVRDLIARGQYDVLTTGRGVAENVYGQLQSTDWRNLTCTTGRQLLRILLEAFLAYLQTQFPLIAAANAPRALAVLDRLLSESSGKA